MYVHNHIVLALSRRRSGYETTNAMEDLFLRKLNLYHSHVKRRQRNQI